MEMEITRARADELCNACQRYAEIKLSLWMLEGQTQAIRLCTHCLYELRLKLNKIVKTV
jgi:hypothetical protein